MIDFLDRFFAQVGSILGPKLGPKSRSRRSQNVSPNFFLIFQDATRTAQEPQEHPGSKFGPFLVPKSDGVPLPGLDFRGYLCEHFLSTTLLAAILFAELIVVCNRVGQEPEVGHSMAVCSEKDSETSRASRLPSLCAFTEY